MISFRAIALGSRWAYSAVLTVAGNPVDISDRQVNKCAVVLCPAEHVCKVINGAPTCVPISSGKACGPTICAEGLQCCNASCGICTKPGQGCTKQACLGPSCGPNVCAFGEQCCNPSCGYCTKPLEACTMEACLKRA